MSQAISPSAYEKKRCFKCKAYILLNYFDHTYQVITESDLLSNNYGGDFAIYPHTKDVIIPNPSCEMIVSTGQVFRDHFNWLEYQGFSAFEENIGGQTMMSTDLYFSNKNYENDREHTVYKGATLNNPFLLTSLQEEFEGGAGFRCKKVQI